MSGEPNRAVGADSRERVVDTKGLNMSDEATERLLPTGFCAPVLF